MTTSASFGATASRNVLVNGRAITTSVRQEIVTLRGIVISRLYWRSSPERCCST